MEAQHNPDSMYACMASMHRLQMQVTPKVVQVVRAAGEARINIH
jgi:hypothetical protein